MIVGLGIDLVEITRIEEAMQNPRFQERILTRKERDYCITPFHVAGRWAAKEAVAKAVGVHLGWQEVEILPNDMGVPTAQITSMHFDPIRFRIHVSITHERTHAAAVAVLEKLVYQAPVP